MTSSRSKVEIFYDVVLSFPTTMLTNKGLALCLTEDIATYMKSKFDQQLQGSEDHVPFPSDWDFTLLQECDLAVGILLDACRNRCTKMKLLHRGGHIECIFFS